MFFRHAEACTAVGVNSGAHCMLAYFTAVSAGGRKQRLPEPCSGNAQRLHGRPFATVNEREVSLRGYRCMRLLLVESPPSGSREEHVPHNARYACRANWPP